MTTAAAGPYMVAAMGFAALLGGAGLLTLRTGAFPRWTGIVALIGARFPHHLPDIHRRHRQGLRVRLRLSARHLGARDLVDRDEHRHVPHRFLGDFVVVSIATSTTSQDRGEGFILEPVL